MHQERGEYRARLGFMRPWLPSVRSLLTAVAVATTAVALGSAIVGGLGQFGIDPFGVGFAYSPLAVGSLFGVITDLGMGTIVGLSAVRASAYNVDFGSGRDALRRVFLYVTVVGVALAAFGLGSAAISGLAPWQDVITHPGMAVASVLGSGFLAVAAPAGVALGLLSRPHPHRDGLV